MKGQLCLFIKMYLYSLFLERVEMVGCEKERDRETKDCYHWHRLETHIKNITSTSQEGISFLWVAPKTTCPVYSPAAFLQMTPVPVCVSAESFAII